MNLFEVIETSLVKVPEHHQIALKVLIPMFQGSSDEERKILTRDQQNFAYEYVQ